MRAARLTLIGLGLVLMAVGGFFFLQDVAPARYPGVVIWVLGAIVLHDGIIAPIAVAVGLGATRNAHRLGRRTVTILQALLVVGAVLTALAIPGLIAVARGSANATLAIGPYALGLGSVWAVLGAAAAAVLLTSRRRALTK